MNEISTTSRKDRFLGSLVGLAVGDAIGTTVEFKRPGSFPPVTDMVGGGPFKLKLGEWTDDTSLALCMGQSLIDKQSFDPKDMMGKFVRWWQKGYMSSNGECFDIGNATWRALSNYAKNPDTLFTTPNETVGNGSLMRLTPVPLFFSKNPKEAISMAGRSSQLTHDSTICISSCQYYAGLIVAALDGESKERILSPFYSPLPTFQQDFPMHPHVAQVAAGSFKVKNPPELIGSGHVVHAMEAALWAFYHTSTFDEGVLKVVNLGDDADTTAAIYGQLAGAFYGIEGIRKDWRQKIAQTQFVHEMASKIYDLSLAR